MNRWLIRYQLPNTTFWYDWLSRNRHDARIARKSYKDLGYKVQTIHLVPAEKEKKKSNLFLKAGIILLVLGFSNALSYRAGHLQEDKDFQEIAYDHIKDKNYLTSQVNHALDDLDQEKLKNQLLESTLKKDHDNWLSCEKDYKEAEEVNGDYHNHIDLLRNEKIQCEKNNHQLKLEESDCEEILHTLLKQLK